MKGDYGNGCHCHHHLGLDARDVAFSCGWWIQTMRRFGIQWGIPPWLQRQNLVPVEFWYESTKVILLGTP